jgi:hypothetical protein
MAIFILAISPTKLLAFHFQPMRPLKHVHLVGLLVDGAAGFAVTTIEPIGKASKQILTSGGSRGKFNLVSDGNPF